VNSHGDVKVKGKDKPGYRSPKDILSLERAEKGITENFKKDRHD
jgi:hypothetical protein